MIAKHRPGKIPTRRTAALLSSCALTALGLALPSAAAAQALQANPNVRVGSPAISTGANTTSVQVNNVETVIDWQPFDTAGAGTIDILPLATTLSFADPVGSIGDFTVLNRIVPVDAVGNPVARAVQFNGVVVSRIVNNPGGQIWFYSPTGIIAGPNAFFDVGSLILTTNDIAFVAGIPGVSPGSIRQPGGLVQFAGPAGSTGYVEIQPPNRPATILARGQNAYVALVAPKVTQAGIVTANGQIAYLAAEQLNMTINGGTFDFQLTVGTTDANGVIHTGTSTGPASTSSIDFQRISMVTLPKNQAMTMLLSGAIGYTPAASVIDEGSSIVLAAGYDVAPPSVVAGNRLGSLQIGNTAFANNVTGYATDAIDILPTGGTTAFQGPFSQFYALRAASAIAGSGEDIRSDGYLFIGAGDNSAGGTVDAQALGTGTISITNELTLAADNGAGSFFDTATPYSNAQGGRVTILADGGSISVGGTLSGSATGFGADDRFGGDGGDGIGGTVDATVTNKGTISATALALGANGFGGFSLGIFGPVGGAAGKGTGGAITLLEDDGQFELGSAYFEAYGVGGQSDAFAGAGAGGTIAIDITSQPQSWSTINATAYGAGGFVAPGGTGNSGVASPTAVRLSVAGPGALTITDLFDVQARGYGTQDGPAGTVGQGGGVVIEAVGGGTLDLPTATVDVSAFLNQGVIVGGNFIRTPTLTGGSAEVRALGAGSLITSPLMDVRASAFGSGAQVAAGDVRGGTVQAAARNGGTLQLGPTGDPTLSALYLYADANGGPGAAPASSFGGTARVIAEDGTVTIDGTATLSASGGTVPLQDIPVGSGLVASGGSASVELLPGLLGTAAISATAINVAANGDSRLLFFVPPPPCECSDPPIFYPNFGNAGAAGTGAAGNATVSLAAGTLTVTTLNIEANAVAGNAAATTGTPFRSGDGQGGIARFDQTGGTLNATTLTIGASGTGGGDSTALADTGQVAALAGNGTGGTAVFSQSGGTLNAGSISLLAEGVGGEGMGHADAGAASNGGNGTGGTARLQTLAGGTGKIVTGPLVISADGIGGVGGNSATGPDGNGGIGTGGAATAETALSDGQFTFGDVSLDAVGLGGAGAAGGGGVGGVARFALIDVSGPTGPRSLGNLLIDASGTGGLGAGGGAAPSTAGLAALVVAAANPGAALSLTGNLTMRALGTIAPAGAGITAAISGAPLTVGGNISLVTSRDAQITATQPLGAAGTVTIAARSLAETGTLSSGGAMQIDALAGISAARLASGAGTLLQALNGPISVTNLTSAGTVIARGASLAIGSSGALTFSELTASAGNATVTATGNLTVPQGSASGALSLTSTGGSVTSATGLTAGGNAEVSGQTGVTLANLSSGGTTLLQAANGAVNVGSLTSAGAVTAAGRTISIASPGALTFADLDATAGAISVTTAGNLGLNTADATGAITLASSGGAIAATGAVNAGGAVSANAPNGVAFAGLNSGGTTLLRAINGAVVATALSSAGPVTALGRSVTIGSPGALTFADLDATAGAATVQTVGNLTVATVDATGAVSLTSTAGALTANGAVNAGGALTAVGQTGVTLGTVNSGGVTSLQSAAGSVNVTNLTSAGAVTASGQTGVSLGTVNSGGATSLQAAGGAVGVTTLASAGPVTAVGQTGVSLGTATSGGATLLQAANGAVAVTSLTSAGAVTAAGRSVTIASPGALTFADLDATAGTISVQTVGNLALNTADATGAITLASSGGAIAATGAVNAGGAVSAIAPGGVAFVGLSSGATTLLRAVNGPVSATALTSAGAVTALGRSVTIASPGALTFADLDATAGAASVQTVGNLSVTTVDATGAVSLRSTGGDVLNTGAVNGAGITLVASGGVRSDANVASSAGLTIDAGGTYTLNALARGTAIGVLAGDIAIGATAALGARGQTATLSVVNRNPARVTFIGGPANAGGFSLDQAEATRLFADISIYLGVVLPGAGVPAGPGTIAVGNLALSYGAGASNQIGSGGRLEISGPGRISITGNVALATSSATDTFSIDPTLIELDTSTGSIAMLQNGAPLGRLLMTAGTIAIGTTGVLPQLSALSDFAAIKALLDQPGGNPDALRAGGITFNAASGLYIQNSGITAFYRDRRGFTANALPINTGGATTRIAVNGQILTAAGPLLGLDTQTAVVINGAPAAAGGPFDPGSTINGCFIGSRCAPPPGSTPPSDSDLVTAVPAGGPVGTLFAAPLVELADTDPLIAPPLVDEPITGVGNDDLWQPRCEDADDDGLCPEGEREP